MTKVARALSSQLTHLGIREVFGNPGTTELPFLEGLVEQQYYLTLHDSIAVGAADGLSQVDRKATVASLHAAVGLGNSIGFVYSAQRNRSPVVLLVGQQDLRHSNYDPLLQANMEQMVSGLVKFSCEPKTVDEVSVALDRAVKTAMTPPFGPTLVSLPMDLMEAEAPRTETSPGSETTSPPAASLEALVERIRGAQKIAIVAGYEVDVWDAFNELKALADRLGAPVYAEPLASRAMVPEALPQFAGDLLPASALITATLTDFDLVLLLGADFTVYPYTPVPLPGGEKVFYLGTDPAVPGRLSCPSVYGKLKELLGALLPLLPPPRPAFRAPRDLMRASRAARAARTMGGYFVLEAATRIFSDHTIVDEAVSLTPVLKSLGVYRGKDSYFGYRSGQLGWGLAASVGISVRRPKVLTVLGDGSLQYAVQSLGTIARYHLPVKILVVNNHSYAILRSYSKAYHPPLIDLDYFQLPHIDIPSLAKGYGLPATTVDSPQALEAELKRFRDQEGPALLNVEIDRTVPDLFS